MARLLSIPLVQIVGILFLVSLVLFLISLQQLRRARKGPYWRARRVAGDRGGRLLIIAVLLFGLTVASAIGVVIAIITLGPSNLIPRDPNALAGVVVASERPTIDPNATIAPTATEAPPTLEATATADQLAFVTNTPSPSTVPVSEASAESESSALPALEILSVPTVIPVVIRPPETATLAHTPTPDFAALLNLTPLPSTRQPREDASLLLVAADSEVSAQQAPVQARSHFDAGITRLYLFISYQNMDDGVRWSRVLYRDGVPVQGAHYLWSLGSAGSSFFFFGNNEGYPAGSYEARLYLRDQEISRIAFTIG